ncbi:MAG: class A sortase, partial [Enterococcus sp.]|nr:class A sortase [Enterococcus sp.]
MTIKTTYTSEKAAEVPLEAVQPPDLADVLAFQRNQTFQASGQLIIPNVDIGLPVFSGVTNQEILVGAGTLFPERTPENHNVVLIGHHLGKESLLFGKLLKVAIGDSIFFEDASGFYQYIVSETKIIDQTDLRILDDHGTS